MRTLARLCSEPKFSSNTLEDPGLLIESADRDYRWRIVWNRGEYRVLEG